VEIQIGAIEIGGDELPASVQRARHSYPFGGIDPEDFEAPPEELAELYGSSTPDVDNAARADLLRQPQRGLIHRLLIASARFDALARPVGTGEPVVIAGLVVRQVPPRHLVLRRLIHGPIVDLRAVPLQLIDSRTQCERGFWSCWLARIAGVA